MAYMLLEQQNTALTVLNEQLETLKAQARELEQTIAANVANLIEV